MVAAPGQLPLRSASLAASAASGAARVKLEQVFENPHAEPLRVKYELPLPADASVSGFAFRIGDRRIVGTVEEVKKARETFERAIAEGRTAAILEETRTSLFAQELGNIPPGATIVAEILIDQPLVWVDVEGSWEWRFPLTAAPRYLGAVDGGAAPRGDLAGRTPDASRVMLDVTDDATETRATLALSIRDALVAGRSPESPSHPLQIDASDATSGTLRVALGGGGSAALDRDLVVRWPVALAAASLSFEAARTGGGGEGAEEVCAVLTVVPPAASASRDAKRVPRDLAILLDTSGSMDGEPLAQAKRIACALVASLADGDGLDMVEFSSAPRRFRRASVRADAATRKEAIAWIKSLRASGGTEMLAGITEALAGLRPEAQRQVVVVTDGLIGFERDVVSAVQRGLPRGSRVHAVGVGSSTNRTLLAGIARVGGGVEVVVGLGEDPERAANRVLARTAAPVIVDLAIDGAAVIDRAPSQLPDLFAGAPARIALRLRPEGGEIVVRGRAGDGAWQSRVTIPPRAELRRDDAAAKLYARERAADLEAELSAGRDKASVDVDLVALGLRYAIATRMTSWVAATEEMMVDPTEPTRRETVPQQLPFGASAAGMGLRPAGMPTSLGLAQLAEADEDDGAVLRSIVHAPPPPMGAPMPASMGAPPPPPPPPAMGRAMAPPPMMMPAPMPQQQQAASRAKADEGASGGGAGAARDEDAQDLAAPEAAPEPIEREEQAKGFLGGLAKKVRDFFASEPEASDAEEAAHAPAKAAKREAAGAAPAVRIVRGRAAKLGERELSIEIEVEGASLDITNLLAGATLITAFAAHVAATVKLTASTRPGIYAAGTTVRIVIVLADVPTSEPEVLILSSSRPGTPVIRVELASP